MSSEIAQAIVRVLDQLASADNRIAVSEAAVDMILTKSGMAQHPQSQSIVNELAELPLIVRESRKVVFQRVRALQEQAQRAAAPTPPVQPEGKQELSEELRKIWNDQDGTWLVHRSGPTAAPSPVQPEGEQEPRLLTAEELIDIERFQRQRRKNPVATDAWLYIAESDRLLGHIRAEREQLENEIFQDATDPSFIAAAPPSTTTVAPKCVHCHHDAAEFNAVTGLCEFDPAPDDDSVDFCGCKCEFPEPATTTAARAAAEELAANYEVHKDRCHSNERYPSPPCDCGAIEEVAAIITRHCFPAAAVAAGEYPEVQCCGCKKMADTGLLLCPTCVDNSIKESVAAALRTPGEGESNGTSNRRPL